MTLSNVFSYPAVIGKNNKKACEILQEIILLLIFQEKELQGWGGGETLVQAIILLQLEFSKQLYSC